MTRFYPPLSLAGHCGYLLLAKQGVQWCSRTVESMSAVS